MLSSSLPLMTTPVTGSTHSVRVLAYISVAVTLPSAPSSKRLRGASRAESALGAIVCLNT